MNTETQNEVVTKEQPKSKRLSSLLWILGLWVFVYLVSGLSGTGWLKMFNAVANIFGLWPVTTLLLLAMFVPNHIYQNIFRWSALFVFLSSFFLLLILDANHVDQVKSVLIKEVTHWTATGIVLSYVLLQSALKNWNK
jgi:hypothetical protein